MRDMGEPFYYFTILSFKGGDPTLSIYGECLMHLMPDMAVNGQ